MYQEYQRKKSDNQENEGVTWLVPQSVEEAEELLRMIENSEQDEETEEEKQENQKFVESIGLMTSFGGIDLEQIGLEDSDG